MRRSAIPVIAAALVSVTACQPDEDITFFCTNYEEQMTILIDRAHTYIEDPQLFKDTLPITLKGLGYLRDAAPNTTLGNALDMAMSDWAVLGFDPAGIANILDEVELSGDPVATACDEQGVQIGG